MLHDFEFFKNALNVAKKLQASQKSFILVPVSLKGLKLSKVKYTTSHELFSTRNLPEKLSNLRKSRPDSARPEKNLWFFFY